MYNKYIVPNRLISLVIPVHNEAVGLARFHGSLVEQLARLDVSYEIIYVDDGSTDESADIIKQFGGSGSVKLLALSKNFGKEIALSAGLRFASGGAVVTLDADGQHPVSIIDKFIDKWQNGAQVVVGVRQDQPSTSFKKVFSSLFYRFFNLLSSSDIKPSSTDYRLLDRHVVDEFNRLNETSRITRGLIDWLGFDRQYIYFKPLNRLSGSATYSNYKLVTLAMNSFVSMTPLPLYFFGFIGMVITPIAFIAGLFIAIEQLLLNDPMGVNFTGTAMLGTLIVFLVGILLLSQGVIGLYLSHIQNQVLGRPLFIINYKNSVGFKRENLG